MAKTAQTPNDPSQEAAQDANAKAQAVQARVLVAGAYGKPDAVVTLPAAEVAAGVAAGELDAHPDAVAYALAQQPA